MLLMQMSILIFVAVTGTAVVLARDPAKQVVGLSFYGLVLSLMFFLFMAPDVALSQIVIGAVALPLLFMLAIAKVRRNEEQRKRRSEEEPGAEEAA